jgi:hypothetical protein
MEITSIPDILTIDYLIAGYSTRVYTRREQTLILTLSIRRCAISARISATICKMMLMVSLSIFPMSRVATLYAAPGRKGGKLGGRVFNACFSVAHYCGLCMGG